MPYLPPYRHELRGIVKPFVDTLSARPDRPIHKRFRSVMDELENIIRGDPIDDSAKNAYLEVVEQCRSNPETVTDEEIAKGIAAVTVATETDILGILYQHTGRTEEDYFNQYFTPPNVATGLATIGRTSRQHFEPPTPSVENVSGKTTLGMFGSDETSGKDTTLTPDGGVTSEAPTTVFFDPACGSGRLLLAAARSCPGKPVVLGWDLDRDAARMTAITLALNNIPGWVVGGNAIHMAVREVYRIAPAAETPFQCFKTFQPENVPPIISNRSNKSESYQPHSALSEPATDVEQAINEINQVLERGIDQTVTNPPFASCDLKKEPPVENRSVNQYATAHQPVSEEDGSLRSSQKYEWLFIELALEFTRSDGNAALIIPTSMLGNPSEKEERKWMLDHAFYEAGFELPPETFAPETTTGTSIVSIIPKPSESTGVDLDYQIFMVMVENVGHDNQASRKKLVQDGEPVTEKPSDLPAHYRAHSWLEIESVPLPDDELIPAVDRHRKMRAD